MQQKKADLKSNFWPDTDVRWCQRIVLNVYQCIFSKGKSTKLTSFLITEAVRKTTDLLKPKHCVCKWQQSFVERRVVAAPLPGSMALRRVSDCDGLLGWCFSSLPSLWDYHISADCTYEITHMLHVHIKTRTQWRSAPDTAVTTAHVTRGKT